MTRRRSRRPADRHAHGHHHGHGHGVGGGMAVRPAHGGARYDRRRERRMRRRHGRGMRHLALGGLLVLVGVIAGLVLMVRLLIGIVEVLAPVLMIAAIGALLFMVLRRTRSRREPGPVAADVSGRVAWERATARFDRIRTEYAEHECDPMAVLRRPALSDVSVASTARFVDAFAEAQAQHTETYPGEPHDAAYVAAVDRAERAWQAARDAADRIRLSGLTPDERTSVERVLKLLTTARDSDSEPERLAAYARARSELDRLDRAGVVHLPRTARAAIDEATRGALPS